MTKQEKARRKLTTDIKLLKASAQVLLQKAIDIEEKLEDVYPPVVSKTGKFELSDEEKARLWAESYARRGIPVNDHK